MSPQRLTLSLALIADGAALFAAAGHSAGGSKSLVNFRHDTEGASLRSFAYAINRVVNKQLDWSIPALALK